MCEYQGGIGMKYKVTFKWTEEVTTTRQLILKADSKHTAEDLVLNSVEPRGKLNIRKKDIDEEYDEEGELVPVSGINGGYRDEIGVEIDKEFWGDADCRFFIEEESK
jgi:hypothetical protein